MIKIIATLLFISTIFFFFTTMTFANLFSIFFNHNETIEIENYELKEDLSDYGSIINVAVEELKDCRKERMEYRTYIGAWELERRKIFFTQPAIDWEELETTTDL